ncbi:nucleoporin complex subunit 54-domain-containing protein [Aspergillus karnatakaensis]|uniref:putative nucleoporin n=1 Tax=Aspergillus karnatakaensis TaxID=1810916 RepID=UPI003CCE4A47
MSTASSLFVNPASSAKPPGGAFGAPAATTTPFGGAATTSAAGTPSLFANTGTQQQNSGPSGGIFGSSNTAAQPQGQQSGGLFGANTAQPQGQQTGGLFGSTTQQKPMFGQTQQQPQQQQQTGGLFGGALGGAQQQPQQQQQQQTGGLFGGALAGAQQKPSGSLFGNLGGQAQQPQQQGSVFGGLGQTQAQTQQQQQQPQQPQQQQSIFGGSLLGGGQQQGQQGPQQQPQLGQSTQPQGSSLWSPGRAITGVHRTVPMQMAIIKDKWDFTSRQSPFRGYMYNQVGEENAPYFTPGVEDDDTKWEEALRKRPDSSYIPILFKGFWELGMRARRQKEFMTALQTRLHDINGRLANVLTQHDLKISVRIADSRRKHLVLSKRCLALAAKTQVLRNRGYAMDDAEEELKKKLTQLERSVFDPSLNGRSEELWARMLAIREHSRRLQAEMERAGAKSAAQTEDELDDNSLKIAKKVLDDYHAQIQHLQKELAAVTKDFEEAMKVPN